MATISYRKNSIAQLQNEAGQMITDHEGKAALLWSAYKQRMGVSNNPQMLFDLSSLIRLNVDLSELVTPFTHEEN